MISSTIHEILSPERESSILASRSTRGLVHDCLALAGRRDPVDAIHDLELVCSILASRLDRIQSAPAPKGGAR